MKWVPQVGEAVEACVTRSACTDEVAAETDEGVACCEFEEWHRGVVSSVTRLPVTGGEPKVFAYMVALWDGAPATVVTVLLHDLRPIPAINQLGDLTRE